MVEQVTAEVLIWLPALRLSEGSITDKLFVNRHSGYEPQPINASLRENLIPSRPWHAGHCLASASDLPGYKQQYPQRRMFQLACLLRSTPKDELAMARSSKRISGTPQHTGDLQYNICWNLFSSKERPEQERDGAQVEHLLRESLLER